MNNTDAEGRLVLADGCFYASDVLNPKVIIDIATLSIGIIHLCSKEERGGCRGEVKGGEKGGKGAQVKLSQIKSSQVKSSQVKWSGL